VTPQRSFGADDGSHGLQSPFLDGTFVAAIMEEIVEVLRITSDLLHDSNFRWTGEG